MKRRNSEVLSIVERPKVSDSGSTSSISVFSPLESVIVPIKLLQSGQLELFLHHVTIQPLQ
jgi:hypothetical protein